MDIFGIKMEREIEDLQPACEQPVMDIQMELLGEEMTIKQEVFCGDFSVVGQYGEAMVLDYPMMLDNPMMLHNSMMPAVGASNDDDMRLFKCSPSTHDEELQHMLTEPADAPFNYGGFMENLTDSYLQMEDLASPSSSKREEKEAKVKAEDLAVVLLKPSEEYEALAMFPGVQEYNEEEQEHMMKTRAEGSDFNMDTGDRKRKRGKPGKEFNGEVSGHAGKGGNKRGPRPKTKKLNRAPEKTQKFAEMQAHDPCGSHDDYVANAESLVSAGPTPEETLALLDKKLVSVRVRRRLSSVCQQVPEEAKDEQYYELRRKNAESARKSRKNKKDLDQRRVKVIDALNSQVNQLEGEIKTLEKEIEIYKEVIRLNNGSSNVGSGEDKARNGRGEKTEKKEARKK